MMINPKDAELQIIYLENRFKDLSAENFALKERLRDEFAMVVLAGMYANGKEVDYYEEDAALHCYEMADAMLKAREQSK